jgi:hypothetical protein
MTQIPAPATTPFEAANSLQERGRIPSRVKVAILIVMLIGLAEPMYGKIRYMIREDISLMEGLTAGWGDVAFGFLFAVAVVLIHETWRAWLLSRWPYGSNDRLRQMMIFGGSIVYGAMAASGFVWVYYTIMYSFDFSGSAAIDLTFTAILIPIAISGVSESFGFHSAYVRERVAHETERRAAADARYDALKNRLAPHFLFNSLGTLAQTAAERPETVENFVNALSGIYRYVLQTEGRERSSLAEEWTAAEALLTVQSQRRPGTLDIKTELPAQFDNNKLIPLSLLTLVENTYKHNVATRAEPLQISIRADEKGVVVENTIRPVLSVEPSGIGLDNLEQRFRSAGGAPVQISQTDAMFRVCLPWLPE